MDDVELERFRKDADRRFRVEVAFARASLVGKALLAIAIDVGAFTFFVWLALKVLD